MDGFPSAETPNFHSDLYEFTLSSVDGLSWAETNSPDRTTTLIKKSYNYVINEDPRKLIPELIAKITTEVILAESWNCLLYTSPSPRDS